METADRELRAGSVISALISLLLVLGGAFELTNKIAVWRSLSIVEQMIWPLLLAVAVALLASSILHTATEKRWIGLWHGSLMTFMAVVIFAHASYGIYDLEKHPRGGFVEMGIIPIYGGMIIFALGAAVSAALTFVHVAEEKL